MATQPTQDCKMSVLTTLGYTGAVSDMLIDYYRARGATSYDLQDAEFEFLTVKGATQAQIEDMWLEYLLSLTIPQMDIDDMKNIFWCDGYAAVA